jgi:hypothetical protein
MESYCSRVVVFGQRHMYRILKNALSSCEQASGQMKADSHINPGYLPPARDKRGQGVHQIKYQDWDQIQKLKGPEFLQ